MAVRAVGAMAMAAEAEVVEEERRPWPPRPERKESTVETARAEQHPDADEHQNVLYLPCALVRFRVSHMSARIAVDIVGRAAPLLRQNELLQSSAGGAGLRQPDPPMRVTATDSAARDSSPACRSASRR